MGMVCKHWNRSINRLQKLTNKQLWNDFFKSLNINNCWRMLCWAGTSHLLPKESSNWVAGKAASRGWTTVLKNLSNQNVEYQNKYVLKKAAKHGRVKVLRWLNRNRGYANVPKCGVINAAKHGQVNVLRWWTHSAKSCNGLKDAALIVAANPAVVDLLCNCYVFDSDIQDSTCCHWARSGRFDILSHVITQNMYSLPFQVFIEAAESGHVEFLNQLPHLYDDIQYTSLYEDWQHTCKKMVVESIAMKKHKLLEWLDTVDSKLLHNMDGGKYLRAAVMYENLFALQWAYKRFPRMALPFAIYQGFAEGVQFLRSIGEQVPANCFDLLNDIEYPYVPYHLTDDDYPRPKEDETSKRSIFEWALQQSYTVLADVHIKKAMLHRFDALGYWMVSKVESCYTVSSLVISASVWIPNRDMFRMLIAKQCNLDTDNYWTVIHNAIKRAEDWREELEMLYNANCPWGKCLLCKSNAGSLSSIEFKQICKWIASKNLPLCRNMIHILLKANQLEQMDVLMRGNSLDLDEIERLARQSGQDVLLELVTSYMLEKLPKRRCLRSAKLVNAKAQNK